MCALQVQAEYASTLIDSEEALMGCIEKYITRQVRGHCLVLWCAVVMTQHPVPLHLHLH